VLEEERGLMGLKRRVVGRIFLAESKANRNTNAICVRFEVNTAMTMKNGVLRDVKPRGSCYNRRF
jgi:hypothetical protein